MHAPTYWFQSKRLSAMAAVKFALVLISPEAIAAASMREPAAPTAASSRRAASRETGSLAGSSPAAAFGSGLVTASAGGGWVKGMDG